MEIIYPFRLSKDMLLFNIMNTHLRIFNFIIIVLQMGVVYGSSDKCVVFLMHC